MSKTPNLARKLEQSIKECSLKVAKTLKDTSPAVQQGVIIGGTVAVTAATVIINRVSPQWAKRALTILGVATFAKGIYESALKPFDELDREVARANNDSKPAAPTPADFTKTTNTNPTETKKTVGSGGVVPANNPSRVDASIAPVGKGGVATPAKPKPRSTAVKSKTTAKTVATTTVADSKTAAKTVAKTTNAKPAVKNVAKPVAKKTTTKKPTTKKTGE